MDNVTHLQRMRQFYESGATRHYDFRRQQLLQLKNALLKYEADMHEALYQDLKKSPEESWITETGFVIAEINFTLKNLRRWMKPRKVKTNLLNFPSRSYVYKEPLGVVLVIGPWNYPLELLFTPLVGAIAAGNCVVLKPSEFAPATTAVMKKVIGCFPEEYMFFVEGSGTDVIPPMMSGFRFDHVFYTGSTEVGRIIYQMAARKLVPVTLELGGKSPCIVESDANIRVTARRLAQTTFSNSGQMCVAPDYLLVHSSVKEQLVAELKKVIHAFYSREPSTSYSYGKIINKKEFERLKDYLSQGTIVFGGRFDNGTHHIEPTLIEDVPLDSPLMQDEIFGPILPVLTFTDFEEAKAIINRNPNPLAFYVFTSSSEKEKKWLTEIQFGGGCVNNASWHLTNFNLPFGGRGNSGIGSYHGKYSFDVFSHQKAVMKTPTWFDPNIKYPPFKGRLKLFKWIMR